MAGSRRTETISSWPFVTTRTAPAPASASTVFTGQFRLDLRELFLELSCLAEGGRHVFDFVKHRVYWAFVWLGWADSSESCVVAFCGVASTCTILASNVSRICLTSGRFITCCRVDPLLG